MTTSAEELFPPRPGGMIDTARQKAMADEAQASQDTPLTGSDRAEYPAVRTREAGCDLARARTFPLSTGTYPYQQLLGRDPQRRAFCVITLDEPVVICWSEQQAQDPQNAENAAGLGANGFVLPVNTMTPPLPYRGVVYATALSGTATRVCVMAFSDSEP